MTMSRGCIDNTSRVVEMVNGASKGGRNGRWSITITQRDVRPYAPAVFKTKSFSDPHPQHSKLVNSLSSPVTLCSTKVRGCLCNASGMGPPIYAIRRGGLLFDS